LLLKSVAKFNCRCGIATGSATAFLFYRGYVMLKSNLDRLYEQLKLVANDIEFAKQNFINSVRIGDSKAKKTIVDELSKKCDELRNQNFDLLEFIIHLLEREDDR
jgi:hypothetical protein